MSTWGASRRLQWEVRHYRKSKIDVIIAHHYFIHLCTDSWHDILAIEIFFQVRVKSRARFVCAVLSDIIWIFSSCKEWIPHVWIARIGCSVAWWWIFGRIAFLNKSCTTRVFIVHFIACALIEHRSVWILTCVLGKVFILCEWIRLAITNQKWLELDCRPLYTTFIIIGSALFVVAVNLTSNGRNIMPSIYYKRWLPLWW